MPKASPSDHGPLFTRTFRKRDPMGLYVASVDSRPPPDPRCNITLSPPNNSFISRCIHSAGPKPVGNKGRTATHMAARNRRAVHCPSMDKYAM